MKTLNEIMQIIAKQISLSAAGSDKYYDYNIVICSERIFLDDYAPKVDDYLKSLSTPQIANNVDQSNPAYNMYATDEGYMTPMEMPYQRTIFFVLKMGQGQINPAVMNSPITIQCLSEENCLDAAREILLSFIQEHNYQYDDGIIQSYFTPTVSSAEQEMYSGFRALISASGNVRVPEDGVVFIPKIQLSVEMDGGVFSDWFDYPFINITFDHSAVPDPQPFAGNKGATIALNRQTSQSISVSTYLWQLDGTDDLSQKQTRFSKQVIEAFSNMNRKFKLAILSNIKSSEENAVNGYLPVFSGYFVLTNASYAQDWGDLSLWNLTFTRSDSAIISNGE